MKPLAKEFKWFLLTLIVCGVFLFVFISSSLTNFHHKKVFAAEDNIYLRITNANTYLYRAPLENAETDNLYFLLPQTYFVELLGEPTSTFYCVGYQGITGFVLKNDVQRVYGTPVQPFPSNITFQIEGVANAIIRSGPNKDTGTYLGVVPFNAASVEYLGSITGQQAMPNLGSLWYYARYVSYEQGTITGYVYAALAKGLPSIVPNTEDLLTVPSNPTNDDVLPAELSDPSTWLLIGLISLPAIFLLYMLFKPTKKGKSKRTAPQQQLPQPITNYPIPMQQYQQLPYYQNRRPELKDDFDF